MKSLADSIGLCFEESRFSSFLLVCKSLKTKALMQDTTRDEFAPRTAEGRSAEYTVRQAWFRAVEQRRAP